MRCTAHANRNIATTYTCKTIYYIYIYLLTRCAWHTENYVCTLSERANVSLNNQAESRVFGHAGTAANCPCNRVRTVFEYVCVCVLVAFVVSGGW